MVGRRLIGKELNNGKRRLSSLLLQENLGLCVCVCVSVSSRRNVATRAQKGWLKERKPPSVRAESAGHKFREVFFMGVSDISSLLLNSICWK